MNENLFVRVETILSVKEWLELVSMLSNDRVMDMYEVTALNKLQAGVSFDIVPDIELDDLPM